ncbi:MAG: CPCC family cysteine-rich protein [bacterium]
MKQLYSCPVCAHLVFDRPNGTYDICPVCLWEDDPEQFHGEETGVLGANGNISLKQARINYRKFSISGLSLGLYLFKIINLFSFKKYQKVIKIAYREEWD